MILPQKRLSRPSFKTSVGSAQEGSRNSEDQSESDTEVKNAVQLAVGEVNGETAQSKQEPLPPQDAAKRKQGDVGDPSRAGGACALGRRMQQRGVMPHTGPRQSFRFLSHMGSIRKEPRLSLDAKIHTRVEISCNLVPRPQLATRLQTKNPRSIQRSSEHNIHQALSNPNPKEPWSSAGYLILEPSAVQFASHTKISANAPLKP